MIEEHEFLFGKFELESATFDKAYYSASNAAYLLNRPIQEVCLMKPGNIKEQIIKLNDSDTKRLTHRRDKIEPLIGHAKLGGQLGKSRMKSDEGTLCAGYGAILGFNTRQLMRKISKLSETYAVGKGLKVSFLSKFRTCRHFIVRCLSETDYRHVFCKTRGFTPFLSMSCA